MNEGQDSRKIANQIRLWRLQEFLVRPIPNEIRAAYSTILWSYGAVVILRKKPKEVASILNNFIFDDNLTGALKENSLASLREIFLLNPFENDGEFFRLSLADPEVIVIGPQKDLAPYQAIAKEQGFQMFDFENMTPEELEFFKVPTHLKPKNHLESSFEDTPLASNLEIEAASELSNRPLYLEGFITEEEVNLHKALVSTFPPIEPKDDIGTAAPNSILPDQLTIPQTTLLQTDQAASQCIDVLDKSIPPSQEAPPENGAKEKIRQILSELINNIECKNNNRVSWFSYKINSKVQKLKAIDDWLLLNDLDSTNEIKILSLIRDISSIKRNPFGFFTPHSLSEFDNMVNRYHLQCSEKFHFVLSELDSLNDHNDLSNLLGLTQYLP